MSGAAARALPHRQSFWSVSAEDYDRSELLTLEEREGEEHLHRAAMFRDYGAVERLYRPIADALSVLGLDCTSTRGMVESRMLRYMSSTGRSMWAWSNADWLELVESARGSSSNTAMRLRNYILSIGIVYDLFDDLEALSKPPSTRVLANYLFGDAAARTEELLRETLEALGYRIRSGKHYHGRTSVYRFLIWLRTTDLSQATRQDLTELSSRCSLFAQHAQKISNALVHLGHLHKPITNRPTGSWYDGAASRVGPEWRSACDKWNETSTLAPSTRYNVHTSIMRVWAWLESDQPLISSPSDWTIETCAAFSAAVDRLKTGDWNINPQPYKGQAGKPVTARTKSHWFWALRMFFRDLQVWGHVPMRFDPKVHLRTPTSIRRLIGPDHKDIDDAVWDKLVWAAANLTADDIPFNSIYPVEYFRALATLWTLSGRRANEILRLEVGCTRWYEETIADQDGTQYPPRTVCLLDVPVGKTATARRIPVPGHVKQAVDAWEAIRPDQFTMVDAKTGRKVHYLFAFQARRSRGNTINRSLIPLLCRKAGVPMKDSKGPITSHRARHTILTRLANGDKSMNPFELAEWATHKDIRSIYHYTRATRLTEAFTRAGGSTHMIGVLVDHDAITSGAAAAGESYMYYDLGPAGYCSHPKWVKCAHRMKCAGCHFNVPRESTKAYMLEQRENLGRYLEDIALTSEEKEALNEDVATIEERLRKLENTPTLDGRTPAQIASERGQDA